ncbi:FAD-dependent oxidoreductase [Nonomuraea sp. NPDC050786]|uniref:protoporphyrinogen/coproporphyrinogen oxidase n=1 Tax=Nonomuraea sp. NPDC050786 TaxID=3154840 RepID=UPI003400E87C
MGVIETDVLVIGAGLAGLSAAATLGGDVIVVDREEEPGGLARSDHVSGWWFDRVLHLLHFSDRSVERAVRGMLGNVLQPCQPDAWIETPSGTVRYPFQLHLADLSEPARVACVADFARATFQAHGPSENYEELLRTTFGDAMCEHFYFPYNRKLWRRPLSTLAPQGFQWNLARPSLEAVLRGSFGADGQRAAYNSNGWYPRPPAGAKRRGMQVLVDAWASRVKDLRLRHTVRHIDTGRRIVVCEHDGRAVSFRFRRACLSTAPLPATAALTGGIPAALREACGRLPQNRVRSVALRILGPHGAGQPLWRYYTDESLPFTRLIFQTSFDSLMAPPSGWGLMAEVTERSEDPPVPPAELASEVIRSVRRVGVIPTGSVVAGTHVMDADPAYVVFTRESAPVVAAAARALRELGVVPLGRYGRWEYSSMEQVMRDGLAEARLLEGQVVSEKA